MTVTPQPTGRDLPSIRVHPPGPKSAAMGARLHEVESRNVTYVSDSWPVFWTRALGANVVDADGNIFVDLTSAFGVALLGHAGPAVQEALQTGTALIHGMGDIHPPAPKLELLEKLAAISPWPDAKVILSTGGSEAVEGALKTGALASGRSGLLAFEGAYHGLTAGSLSATPRAHFRSHFEDRLYGGVTFAPYPDPLRDPTPSGARSLHAVRAALRDGAPNGDPIGTIIIEPVQARGGARIPPDGFLAELSSLAAEYDALVIADEIMTGMGRCGALLASPGLGLDPDIVVVGKALGGGMPISASIASARVMNAWPASDGEAIHTSTFLGHPLSCTAACAVLDMIESADIARQAQRLGTTLLEGLSDRVGDLPGVADVRGLGLLLGIEFVEGDGLTPAHGRGARVAEAALPEGLILLPGGDHGHVLELTPPVTLTQEQVEHAIRTIGEVVERTP
ncbi:MAG: aspartate aminotransferase family protein [Longimicrobiales bacterium]|nr:aspartate aminotransferase family protein [Longimicrobiales bacterium]